MTTLWITILNLVSGFFTFANKVAEYIKEQRNIETGKDLKNAEIKAKEAEIAIKQAEIIVQPKTKEETVKQLEDGKF